MAEVKYISCREVGVDCDFEAKGATVEEVLKACAEHATTHHGMHAFGPELYNKMRAHIRTVTE